MLFLLNIKVPYLRPINLCTCPTLIASYGNRPGNRLLILFLFKFTFELKVLWQVNCERLTALEGSIDYATFNIGMKLIFA